MTIAELKQQNLILLECISGSKAYGTDLPTSDTDIRGVFILPQKRMYGLGYVSQVADETNDTVYFELGRYIELLLKNNPNILELLATPKEQVLYKDPLMDNLKPALFLSKKCKDTFGGYAFTQIRKARGLNKKIVNPVEKEKKTVLDFCYILKNHGSVPLQKWLEHNNYEQDRIGLVNIPHFKDTYALFYDTNGKMNYRGIMRKPSATTVLLSSIPKTERAIAYLSFNQDGFTKYCKDYTAYWDWVAKRNEDRYNNNVKHGKNYDSKNMMHTFRLLDMAYEILTEGAIHVRRPNRQELLRIRRGEFEYDNLIEKAEAMMKRVEEAYLESQLPNEPDKIKAEKLLVDIRAQFYNRL